MAVISFIPILYSGFFRFNLGSRTDKQKLPVAFVNEDKGTTANNEILNVCESVEKKLKGNTIG